MDNLYVYKKEVRVVDSYDVIVVGGGTAGVFAAVSAAREGMKTLIIEQFGALGGTATMGMVTPMMPSYLPDDRGHCPLGNEINSAVRELGGTEDNDYLFDPTVLKIVLEKFVKDSGCDILFHTVFADVIKEDNRVKQILVCNKDGLSAYECKTIIDCTGDADVAVAAGVPFESGNENNINQAVSLRFEMAGIDYDSFHNQMRELGNDEEKYFAMNTAGMRDILNKAVDDGVLTKQDIVYFQGFGIPGKPDAMAFNCPELKAGKDIANADFITQKQIEGKQAILRLRTFLRKYIKGFEKAYITEIAPMVGLRETRRIKALLQFTAEDVYNYRKYDDAITKSMYPLDIHGAGGIQDSVFRNDLPEDERYWEVPFRCMVAQNTENVLVAGRCAGFDFKAQSAARIQIICRAMGEAAGIGAAYSVRKNLAMDKLPFAEIAQKVR